MFQDRPGNSAASSLLVHAETAGWREKSFKLLSSAGGGQRGLNRDISRDKKTFPRFRQSQEMLPSGIPGPSPVCP